MSDMKSGSMSSGFDKFNITFQRKEIFNDGRCSGGCISRLSILCVYWVSLSVDLRMEEYAVFMEPSQLEMKGSEQKYLEIWK